MPCARPSGWRWCWQALGMSTTCLAARPTPRTPSGWRSCARWGCCVAVSSPAEIAAVGEVCRDRKKLTQARTSELQRLCKVLEDGGVKIDSVASSITTRSARAMVEALVAGERDPRVLAELARGAGRKKLPDLAMARAGRFGAHHALLARMHLEHIDHLSGMIGRLDGEIDQLVAPFAEQVGLLRTIPGSPSAPPRCSSARSASTCPALRPPTIWPPGWSVPGHRRVGRQAPPRQDPHGQP